MTVEPMKKMNAEALREYVVKTLSEQGQVPPEFLEKWEQASVIEKRKLFRGVFELPDEGQKTSHPASCLEGAVVTFDSESWGQA